MAIIENKIYKAIIRECELLEEDKIYRGNGHHLAQKLTRIVSICILSNQQRKVFDTLSIEPKSTREISFETGIPSKNVSTILGYMFIKTSLITFTRKGKLKYWFLKQI